MSDAPNDSGEALDTPPERLRPHMGGATVLEQMLPTSQARGVWQQPPAYPSRTTWVVAGMQRFPGASVAALASAWLGLYTAVFGAGLGALLGLVISPFIAMGALSAVSRTLVQYGGAGFLPTFSAAFSSSLVSTAPFLVVPLLGTAVGFVGGLVGPFALESGSIGLPGVFGSLAGRLVAGLVLGVVWVALVIWIEPWRLKLSGARELSKGELHDVVPAVEQAQKSLNLSGRRPVILANDDPIPGAYTYTRHIVVSHALLDRLRDRPDALTAIFAHELAHWDAADSIGQEFVFGCALPVTLANEALTRLFRVLRPQGDGLVGLVRLVVYLAAWPLPLLLRFVIGPVLRMEGRNNEYACDARAAKASRLGMLYALSVLREFEVNGTGWNAVILNAHPPVELRISRLWPTDSP